MPSTAVPLYERMLADRQRVLGRTHTDTLYALYELVVAYGRARRLAEAVPVLERTVADCERELGQTHPDILAARHDLATAYKLAGR